MSGVSSHHVPPFTTEDYIVAVSPTIEEGA